jgi:antitoxin (DNA-binding transcriptional repressor) of toxin-antitoxin stability system
MKFVSKRELNQQTAQVLALVDAGEPVVVTERGIARWRIEAMDAASDPVSRLFAEGRVQQAKADPAAWPKGKPRYSPTQVDALFVDSRGEH